jgi:hypothetical protein
MFTNNVRKFGSLYNSENMARKFLPDNHELSDYGGVIDV